MAKYEIQREDHTKVLTEFHTYKNVNTAVVNATMELAGEENCEALKDPLIRYTI